jgi:hypothetical protein
VDEDEGGETVPREHADVWEVESISDLEPEQEPEPEHAGEEDGDPDPDPDAMDIDA